jgi:predicted PurR-regulated permease PerM
MAEPPAPQRLRVDLSAQTISLGIGAVVGAWLFLQLWPVLLVVVVALMLMGMFNPFVEQLERRRLRRGHAIAAVFVALFVALGLFGAFTVPRFVSQISDMVEKLPETLATIAQALESSKLGAPLAKSLRETRSAELVASAERLGLSYSSKIVEIVAYAASSFFLALYLIVDRDRMRGATFAIIPRSHHVRVSRILLNLETIVGGYLRGQVITSAMMAVFTFAVLSIAHVPNAVALALLAGMVDVLPYVGALLACCPAALAALSRGTTTALLVLAVLAAYQEVESRLIVPRIYGKVLRLPAASVMIALLVGGKLLGILGALLALPIAAGVRMIVAELRVDLPGEDLDDSELRKRDDQEEREFERRAAGVPAVEAAAIAMEIAEERRAEDAPDPADAAEVPITSGLNKGKHSS